MRHGTPRLLLLALLAPAPLAAQEDPLTAPYSPGECESCAAWNEPQAPFRIFGDTYFVGTRGLSVLLVASDSGHVLIDGGIPASAPLVLANIQKLGFDPDDVVLILNSHAHHDHAGGIAALQRATGAVVAASAPSARVLEGGASGPDDPQYGTSLDYPPVREVHVFADGDVMRVGPLALTALLTPGHTPGSTTWSWRSCQEGRCLDMVYADSQTPVSADGFLFTRNDTYPAAVRDFERGFAVLERLPCDVLVTPHPGASGLWERVASLRENPDALVDPGACRRYAANARQQLARRIAAERAQR